MLTRIIFRTCILLVLTTMFACVPDEPALPNIETDALLMTNETGDVSSLDNAFFHIINQDEQPTACIYEPCSSLLPKLYKAYLDLANETCETQWYCATCCMENKLTEIMATVKPNKKDCITAVGADALASPVPGSATLAVAIVPNYCLMEGATLWATNPVKPGNPPYNQAIYTVEWFRNGQLIGTGAHLSDCICGENVTVKVLNTLTGAKGSAVFLAKPCSVEMEEEDE